MPANPLVLIKAAAGTGGQAFLQQGRADVQVGVTSLDGGQVKIVRQGPGHTPALRFPAYTSAARYPRAMVVVDNAGRTDELDPGEKDFTWGADFDLDATTAGRSDDNGNNIVQRGLSSESSLFKAEVDENMRPTCTVRGSKGMVIARSNIVVIPGTWYRVRCTRVGEAVKVQVGPVLSDGTVIPIARTVPGPIGLLHYAKPDVSISIGGKVGSTGLVYASSSDQFNGLIRRPFFTILR